MENVNTQNPVKKIIETHAKYGFVPSKEFYQKVQINSKRWSLLLHGKKPVTVVELKAICLFFNANINEYTS
ncbi:MAG: hypothetical protein Q7W45_08515 [Bacteroidota bacterium]|nr:hypothetical protein [Bacteroidota bacterium]MDP3144279.1 hypothetical protein [Bacteroidota bacterium]